MAGFFFLASSRLGPWVASRCSPCLRIAPKPGVEGLEHLAHTLSMPPVSHVAYYNHSYCRVLSSALARGVY
jgi:hypothetical protein